MFYISHYIRKATNNGEQTTQPYIQFLILPGEHIGMQRDRTYPVSTLLGYWTHVVTFCGRLNNPNHPSERLTATSFVSSLIFMKIRHFSNYLCNWYYFYDVTNRCAFTKFGSIQSPILYPYSLISFVSTSSSNLLLNFLPNTV